MSPIKTRICEYLDYKRIKKKDFFKTFQIASSSFRGRNADSEMTAERVASILTVYSDLNYKWLMMGIGEMILSDNKEKMDTLSADSTTLADDKADLTAINSTLATANPAAFTADQDITTEIKRGRGRPRKVIIPEVSETEIQPSAQDMVFSEPVADADTSRQHVVSIDKMARELRYYLNLYNEEKAYNEYCMKMIQLLNDRLDRLVKDKQEESVLSNRNIVNSESSSEC